jgi:hypothetical protein
MRKPPETGRKRRAAGRGAWIALGIAGTAAVAGLYLWAGRDSLPTETSRRSFAEALTDARRDLVESLREPPQAAPADAPAAGPLTVGAQAHLQTVDPPPAGSMQASLLGTSAGDRNHLFWRTIADAGYVCDEVRTAIAMVSTGSAWRANCGGTETYLVEVGEFGRLRVVPILYNDTLTPVPIRVVPDEREPTLQFREP